MSTLEKGGSVGAGTRGRKAHKASSVRIPDALRACGLFQHVPDFEVDLLAAQARMRRLGSRELLCAWHETPDCVWIVESGSLSYSNVSQQGGEVIVGVVGRGSVVGLACLTDGRPMHSDVRSHQPCLLIELPVAELNALLARHPLAWKAIARFAFTRMRVLVEMRLAQSHSNLLSRVSWQLLSQRAALAKMDGKDAPGIPLSQSDLAKLVSSSRSRINEALARLVEMGLVSVGYRSIEVRDPAGLRRLTDGEILWVDDSRE